LAGGLQPNNLMQMTTRSVDLQEGQHRAGTPLLHGLGGFADTEDYPEAGSMWEHLGRNQIKFRNYGEGFEFPGVMEDEDNIPPARAK